MEKAGAELEKERAEREEKARTEKARAGQEETEQEERAQKLNDVKWRLALSKKEEKKNALESPLRGVSYRHRAR